MEKDPESSEATTLVGMFDSGAVNGKYHSTEGSQEVDTKGTNEQLAARLVELEEQNKLLLSENAVLGDSVKLYQSQNGFIPTYSPDHAETGPSTQN